MSETRAELEKQIAVAQDELEPTQRKLVNLRRRLPPEPVKDDELKSVDGPVKLSEMFGDKDDLILIHNMGAGCSNCTMWADKSNGVVHHLQSRAAIVVVSPDGPKAQQDFAQKRGWRFTMYSAEGATFLEEMGFRSEDEEFLSGYQPGVSVFHRNEDGTIVRVSKDEFGPGDLYCSAWHLFNLLPDGWGNWDPQFDYSSSSD